MIFYFVIFLSTFVLADNSFVSKTIVSPDSVAIGNPQILIDGNTIKTNKNNYKISHLNIVKNFNCNIKSFEIATDETVIYINKSEKCNLVLPKILENKVTTNGNLILLKDENEILSNNSFTNSNESNLNTHASYFTYEYEKLKNLNLTFLGDVILHVNQKIENLNIFMKGDIIVDFIKPPGTINLSGKGDITFESEIEKNSVNKRDYEGDLFFDF